MSKLEELIQRLCLEKVEYKTIGEVCDLITDYVAAGSFEDLRKNVKYCDTPDFAQLVRTTDIKSKFTNEKFVYVSESAFKFLWRVNLDKELLILPNIGNCGEVYYIIPDKLPYSNNVLGPNAILVRSEKHSNRFLYHLFQTPKFQMKLYKITSQTGQSKFNKTDLKKLIIPVPPIEIQQEIVRILDTFTTLEAELEAELEARKKQYEYYKSLLITNFSEYNTAEMTIGDIYDFQYGTGNTIPTDGGKYPVYGSNGIVGTHSLFNSESSPVIGHIGAYAGIVNWGEGKHFVTYNGVICKHKNDRVIKKYAFYILKAQDYNSKSKNSSQPFISYSTLMEPIVKIPSIEEQQRIVTILDHFDTLVNDLSHGLPAEIAARRKQYEYYRNKLLTFKEVKHESV